MKISGARGFRNNPLHIKPKGRLRFGACFFWHKLFGDRPADRLELACGSDSLQVTDQLKQKLPLYLLLLFTGVAWGLTVPLTRVAVSTGYQPLGLVFWQLVIVGAMSGALVLFSGRRLPFSRRYLRLFVGVIFLGTILPDYLLYTAAAELPAGIMAILISLVPMFSLPLALALGFEKPNAIRLLGAVCGAISVALMIGPETSLPDPSKIIFVFVALGAAAFYASQGNFITWYGTRDLNAVQILLGSSVLGLVFVTPAALTSGQFINLFIPWGSAEWAILGTSGFHGIAYAGFLALVAKAGPVFTSQVAYLVTGSGVLWSMLLLGERYSGWIWAAFALMFAGIILVQPRKVGKKGP